MTMRFGQQKKVPVRAVTNLPPPHVIDDWLKRQRQKKMPFREQRPVIELPMPMPEPPQEKKKDRENDFVVDYTV